MSNSSLVTYTKISPHSDARRDTIKKITIHHMAGNLTVEECGAVFQRREASTNYGIDGKGNVGLYVDESRRAWATANPDNDHQAINIELANDEVGGNWHVSDTAINKCIELCVDICKRNGIKKINYTGDKSGNLTMHRWFMTTACPGDYLAGKFPYIADEINKRLNGSQPTPEPTPSGNTWTGSYPSLPSRGYYQKGDGYDTYVNMKSDIKLIQEFMNWAIDAKLDIDGEYGDLTTKAVKDFQSKTGIDVDGRYGKDTRSAAQKYQKISSNTTKLQETAQNSTKPQESAKNEVKASQAAQSYNASIAGTYYVNSRTGLNVRDGAGTGYKVLTAIPLSTKVECYGFYTDADGTRWLYVAFEKNGTKYIGFVSARWLSK